DRDTSGSLYVSGKAIYEEQEIKYSVLIEQDKYSIFS
ncbi:unnamed protein product, partial [marine sediment metagenome]